MTLRSRACEMCGVSFNPTSGRQKYCNPCRIEVSRDQNRTRKLKQREKEDWLKEPVSLQERLSELSNWGSYEGDDFVHPDRWFTGDNYINYHYEEIVDLLEEQKHEDD